MMTRPQHETSRQCLAYRVTAGCSCLYQPHTPLLCRVCRRYKVPTLVVGGGGYTLRNVARCWCYETGRLMGHDLPDKLPESVLNTFNYYMDNERLRIEVGCPLTVT